MLCLDNDDLKKIQGGASISGALINSFTSGIKTILEVGRSFGGAIRRIASNSYCSL